MIRRHLSFILISALASAASSGLLLAPGLRAGWLGACLALGIVFLNYKNGPELDAGRAPSLLWVLPAGLLAGLAAGLPLSFIGGLDGFDMFITPKGWPMLLAGVGYGVLLGGAYALRWRFSPGWKRSVAVVVLLVFGGWLAGTLRGMTFEAAEAAAGVSLITGVPFALFWASAVTDYDPAYTLERWAGTAEPGRRTGWATYLVVGVVTMVFLGMGLPSMHGLMESGKEAGTKGNLGSIRSALQIYYGDNEGISPESLGPLTIGSRYLPAIPQAKPGAHHPPSSAVKPALDDSGGWVYSDGSVFVNCTHTDARGSVWTSY